MVHCMPAIPSTWPLCSLRPRYFELHAVSGTHCVFLALWQSRGRVRSVIQTLPTHVLQGILVLFKTVYRIVQRSGPLTHLKGDAVDVDDDEQEEEEEEKKEEGAEEEDEEEEEEEGEKEGHFCLGQEHKSRAVREREASEWPPDH